MLLVVLLVVVVVVVIVNIIAIMVVVVLAFNMLDFATARMIYMMMVCSLSIAIRYLRCIPVG